MLVFPNIKKRFNNFHEYFKNKLSIKTDGESSTLTISTYAFSPEDAKSFNLSLVYNC